MNKKLIAASALAVALFAQPVMAASTAPQDLDVSVTVLASCSVTASPMDFGDIGTLTTGASAVTATANIDVTCTSDADYEIAVSLGANASGAQRRLRNPSGTNEYINYQLYNEPTRTNVWGSNLGEDTVAKTGNNSAQTSVVYGSIPAGQPVSLGDYEDTVEVTVWYDL